MGTVKTRMRLPLGIAAAVAVVATGWSAPPKTAGSKRAPAPPALDYNRDIRPILSDNCFQCHGPDANARQAGLRLDDRNNALAKKAIVPGKPLQSNLMQRVRLNNSPLAMPPASSHKRLTREQVAKLDQWVREGAAYRRHWSFEPLPRTVPVPAVAGATSPIDALVRARLAGTGFKPSPKAPRETLIRRASLDLTGLPPTPAEVDAFVNDKSVNAFERVVDRLLSSPHFGERMATPWLDIARYGDSYGYQSDQLSPTWPYRDWVVRAFNRNLPYDRFVVEQLAGDMLPGADREQRLATAFNRLHRMTNEGGSVAEEWRLEYVADRVRTLGTAFLGLTLECARCHDHKFDPVSQRDYYSFTALFNSIDEYGLYNQSDIVPTPTVLLPQPNQEKSITDALEAVRAAESALNKAKTDREAAFQEWRKAADRQPLLPDRIGWFDFDDAPGAGLTNKAGDKMPGGSRTGGVASVPGRSGNGVLLDGEENVSFPGVAPFTRHTPWTIAFWMKDARTLSEPMVVFHASSGTDVGFHGYDLRVEKGILSARIFRHWPGNAIAVRTTRPIVKDAWTHVAVVYDGSSRAGGLRIDVNGRPADIEIVRDRLWKGIGQHTLTFGQRFRDRGFQGGAIDELSIFSRALTPLETAQLVDGARLADALAKASSDDEPLRAYYFSAVDDVVRKAADSLASARRAVWAAEDPVMEVPAMEEMPSPRPTWVLARGSYDAPRTDANRVGRTLPAALTPDGKTVPIPDRLAFARWLVSPDHPLTARVAVNRIWGLLFGQALVETVEDFGVQGSSPSNPALLDWLARDFVDNGWDIKRLVRRIVLSETWQQSSSASPKLRQADPTNRLLARGPSHRLSAETIRDVALAAAGLLDHRFGGPPVSPYQPGDLWRETNTMSPGYRQSVGTDLYRRSLYTVWKRTAPMANMMALDASSREVCVARRSSTNTPLQALVLLNDPQFVEAARVLAERTLIEKAGWESAFVRLAGRRPTEVERAILDDLHRAQIDVFRNDPAATAALLAVGERKPAAGLDPVEVAATTVVCQAILNLDATLWKR